MTEISFLGELFKMVEVVCVVASHLICLLQQSLGGLVTSWCSLSSDWGSDGWHRLQGKSDSLGVWGPLRGSVWPSTRTCKRSFSCCWNEHGEERNIIYTNVLNNYDLKIICNTFVVKQDEVDQVILVGGSTRVPKVQDVLLTAVGKYVF